VDTPCERILFFLPLIPEACLFYSDSGLLFVHAASLTVPKTSEKLAWSLPNPSHPELTFHLSWNSSPLDQEIDGKFSLSPHALVWLGLCD
jgi:hypothetical protein